MGAFLVRSMTLPCSSKIDVSWLFRILEQGADGIEVVGCPKDKCRLLRGSVRAEKRVIYAQSLLEEAGLNPNRLGFSNTLPTSIDGLMDLARARCKAVEPLGPNPMKKGQSK